MLIVDQVVSFDELINEFIDICRPEQRGRIHLSEIKKSALGYNIFSAITNVRATPALAVPTT